MRLYLAADVLVGVSGPRDVGLDSQRRVQWMSERVRNDDAVLGRDQGRADVIWMTTDAQWLPAAGKHFAEQRAQVGDEAIVPRHQLIQLPASGGVLILETMRLAR